MEDTEESCSSNNGSTKPDIHTTASTPSSPGREPLYSHAGFFYSAPSSPMHHMLTSASFTPLEDAGGSFEFELSGEPAPLESMTSADELFLNGQIRPMKLSSHLQRHQDGSPLTDNAEHEVVLEDNTDRKFGRGRANFPARDRRRKARSMSPLRSNTAFQWLEDFKFNDGSELMEVNESKAEEDKRREDNGNDNDNDNETPSSGASSRSSSVGRSSKRWIFLKELLYRSKSEGRNSTNNTNSNRNLKFWSTLSFNSNSSNKNQKSVDSLTSKADEAVVDAAAAAAKSTGKKAVNGLGLNRKRVGRSASAHEVHYTRNRAQAEEMRKKTYLPYRQGLLGCLGFSSKSYGAMNGFARALNPVSSR
ncbi:uncharacterized protein LOC143632705 [Bidens hawaiensis]|uniref:uncharacterized protein LOC143632705 n=1 Tax=Bidens hawaiensis TaxID=980011 RepID=UPI00404915A7